MYSDLDKIITYICEQHQKQNELWKNSANYCSINLKKKLVSHIVENPYIMNNIVRYLSFLSEASTEIEIDNNLFKISAPKMRVKNINSIETKINRYYNSPNLNGKSPINKCLNDLLGFRIIIDSDFAHSDIENFVNNKYSSLQNITLKCTDSSKYGYIATHIYFHKKGDNSVFPWELQIWKKSDEINNINQHKIYKQEYTNWEEMSNLDKEVLTND